MSKSKSERQKNSFVRLLNALENEATKPVSDEAKLSKIVHNLQALEIKLFPPERTDNEKRCPNTD